MQLGAFREYRIPVVVLCASVLTHATVAILLLRIPHERTAQTVAYEIELSGGGIASIGSHGNASDTRDRPLHHLHERLELGGQTSSQNVDDFERGERGDAVGSLTAVRLASEADAITLQDSPMNAVGQAQAQRIRTASDRATHEVRRATPHPSDQAFLASGQGEHRERRRISTVDPRSGAPNAAPAALLGADAMREPTRSFRSDGSAEGLIVFTTSEEEAAASNTNDATALSGTRRDGQDSRIGDARSSVGRGIQHGRTERESNAARVASGRPPVDEGNAATQTEWRSPDVRDNQDAELLAARMLQSMVDSSQRSGRHEGVGNGGVGGGGTAGVGGGTESGGRAQAYAPGGGRAGALDTSESRYRLWMLELRRRVNDQLTFPRQRQIAMDQGQSVFHVLVRRDGTLAAAPELVHRSGFDDLDAAARLAIERSAPFPPVPTDVAVGTDILRTTIPITFSNPMVR